jgi:hypothetical protein
MNEKTPLYPKVVAKIDSEHRKTDGSFDETALDPAKPLRPQSVSAIKLVK